MTALAECRGVAVGYDHVPVLHDIDLRVGRGEIVAILGTSGCGKSTLLRALVGLLPPQAGTIELFGEPLYASRDDERRARLLRRTGTAFQQDALFGALTVEDNLALPPRELTRLPDPVIRELVRMRLGLVGLAGFEHRAVTELSGGERKRAALARATILDPELVFCDEPTAGLDPVVGAGIDALLLALRDTLGCAFLVVSHAIASVRTIADRALLLAGGTIYASGTVAELAASRDPRLFAFFHRAEAS